MSSSNTARLPVLMCILIATPTHPPSMQGAESEARNRVAVLTESLEAAKLEGKTLQARLAGREGGPGNGAAPTATDTYYMMELQKLKVQGESRSQQVCVCVCGGGGGGGGGRIFDLKKIAGCIFTLPRSAI